MFNITSVYLFVLFRTFKISLTVLPQQRQTSICRNLYIHNYTNKTLSLAGKSSKYPDLSRGTDFTSLNSLSSISFIFDHKYHPAKYDKKNIVRVLDNEVRSVTTCPQETRFKTKHIPALKAASTFFTKSYHIIADDTRIGTIFSPR